MSCVVCIELQSHMYIVHVCGLCVIFCVVPIMNNVAVKIVMHECSITVHNRNACYRAIDPLLVENVSRRLHW